MMLTVVEKKGATMVKGIPIFYLCLTFYSFSSTIKKSEFCIRYWYSMPLSYHDLFLLILFRCPLYYNLAKDCTLVKKDGECCQQPVCNFHQTISKFESSGKGRTPNGIGNCIL